jgi:Fur family transcriptional regulator, ferric uptake regulator
MTRRNTRQRETIIDVLEQSEGPLSIPQILERAHLELPNLGLATVYRTVNFLRDEQKVLEVALPGEEARFEIAKREHHHHFRCQNCGKVFELDFCPLHLPAGTLLPNGYRVMDHHLTLYGLCERCDQLKNRKRGQA